MGENLNKAQKASGPEKEWFDYIKIDGFLAGVGGFSMGDTENESKRQITWGNYTYNI